MKKSSTSS